jgi:hypothetical protein
MRRNVVILAAAILLAACGGGAVTGGTGDSNEGVSGIRGRVLLGPTCPVEVVGSPCPDRPIQATVRVLQGDVLVKSVRSGEDGRFRIELDPGAYTLLAEVAPDGVQSAAPVDVRVPQAGYADVSVHVDSGIR